jgi:DnaA-homolog protein
VKQLLLDLIPAPRPTLANFVAGRNLEALEALKELVDGASTVKVVYLWGEPGAGKSHLVAALADAAGWCDALSAGADTPTFLDRVDALEADEQQQVFNLINEQQPGSGRLVAAGAVAPRDLPLRRDLASRLGSGLVFQLHALSDAEKSAALKAHAQSRGFNLREDVLGYLLRHSRRDMPSLMKFLDAIDRHSIETGREITVPMLKELAQPALGLSA